MKEILNKTPLNPGIYLMKDYEGKIIYVGKAKSLKKRVSQYFSNSPKSVRIKSMVSQIKDIEYIVTKNELEALVLECNYIKENMPKYNVLLKDDKTYPYIKIDVKERFPGIYITRQKKEDGSIYLGPYTDVSAVREVMRTVKEIFPLKRCKYNLNKKTNKSVGPCLYYHIGRCMGPCINEELQEDYKELVKQVIMFLEGNTKAIGLKIKEDIENYITKLDFEKANLLKNRLESIKKVGEKQNVGNIIDVDVDVWGYILKDNKLYIQIFKVRDSKVSKHDTLEIEYLEKILINRDLFSLIAQYYLKNQNLPKEVCINIKDEDKEIETLNKYLSSVAKHTVKIVIPKKGSKMKLVKMVENNILLKLEKDKEDPLTEISNLLGLEKKINKIEAYDISNLRNEYIVGTMITYEDGKLNKNKYRKFKVKSTLIQNDTMSMAEIIKRRIKHIDELPLPDCMFIDGGKGQVSKVKEVLNELKININVIGMIKSAKHKTTKILDLKGKEIEIGKEYNLKNILNFVTFIQDEVHRFTINYHRSLRDRLK